MAVEKVREKYKCFVCGNMVTVIMVGGGTLVCCGEEMDKIGEPTPQSRNYIINTKSGLGKMDKMRKITMLSVLLVIALFGVPSCAPTVSQQEYDRVSNELSAIQSQLASLQGKLAEVELLQAQNEELNKQYDAVKSEFEAMQAKYEELSTEYEELSKQFDIIIEEPVEINEEDVEQAVFKLINQERQDNGLSRLTWGRNLYKQAMSNSRNMATNKQLEYPSRAAGKEVYWAAGHNTTDGIANATLTILKNKEHYELNFFVRGFRYSAVAVYKSGEIFYITCMADYYQ